MKLHNTWGKAELISKLTNEAEQRVTLSFYRYAHILNPVFFRDYLWLHWNELGVLGRIYVAHEGINAQLSVPYKNLEKFKDFLNSIRFLENTRLNIAIEDDGKSFLKLAIKVRDKILADGLNDSTFDVTKSGEHLNAEAFNRITESGETVIVDMRNHYESEIGKMQGAITPDVDSFRESLPIIADLLKDKKERPVVMYCTGGIRCEKASAWFRHLGFKNVYQLEGGIIEYVRRCQEDNLPIKFKGKNFVFDERRAESVTNDIISACHQCGQPADTHTNCQNKACNLLFIQCEACKKKMNGCCSQDCIHVTSLPINEQIQYRKLHTAEKRYFAKGRAGHLLTHNSETLQKNIQYHDITS